LANGYDRKNNIKEEKIMENKKTSDFITVNRENLKAEMRSAFGEVIGEGVKNIGELLISTFCGTSMAVPPQSKPHTPIAETAIPPRDELLKIVSGYLYMALGELKYERKDILPIIQRIEKYMTNSDYENALTAYQNAENEFLAMLESNTAVQTAPASTPRMIAGIDIPAKLHDYRIEQLIYSSNISKGKTAQSLKAKGITHIRDFFKPENSNLNSILSVKGKKSFIEALEQTIAGVPAEESAPAVSATAPEIPKRDIYEVNGVIIPEEKLDKRVDSLKFPSKVSRTKLTNKLKKHNVIYLRDFFAVGTPPLYKMISQGGKKSFLESLRNSL
jgi:hypothetical protein